MKKKFILFFPFLFLFVLTGCDDMMNTPTKRVEEHLSKYQMMDKDVLKDLDRVVEKEDASDKYKKEYKALMEKQYQNLSYKIKDEENNGDTAEVEVEIEVFDYQSALDDAEEYISNHEEEFEEEEGKTREEKIEEFKIKRLKATTDKAYYTIDFHLEKEDKKWKIEKVDESTIEKIHGLYENA